MIADRIRSAIDRHATTLANPADWLVDSLTGGIGPTYSGKRVTPESALGLIPYFSGVQLIAGAVGSLPLIVYSTAGDVRERAPDTDQWRILHDKPNPEMTADQLWELSEGLLLTWGNSFFWKERSRLGTIGELWPLGSNRVKVFRDEDGQKRYLIDGGMNGVPPLTDQEVLHVPGLGCDGLVGYSPVQVARQELASMLALQEFAGRVWSNSAVPLGYLKHPNKLDDDVLKRLRKSWRRAHRGARNFGKPAILEEGMTWESIGMPLEDAQFIESQKHADLRAAQLLNLPPYRIGAETPSSMTYSNAETEGMDFVRYTLRRWLTRHQNALRLDPTLFPPRLQLTCEFLVDALQEADTKTRYEADAIVLDRGALTINEWRRRENRPPVPWGDRPFRPLRASDPAKNGNGAHDLDEAELDALIERASR